MGSPKAFSSPAAPLHGGGGVTTSIGQQQATAVDIDAPGKFSTSSILNVQKTVLSKTVYY